MDPTLVVVVFVFGGIAAAWRWRRHEPARNIALDVGGYVIFMIGLGWASAQGWQPFLAAGLASGGMALTAEAIRRARPTANVPV